jgi:PEGA domain
MRSRTGLIVALVVGMTVGGVGVARAQQPTTVSDADRKAARDLYQQGVPLQQAGKFAEALDAFTRSFQVYPAPTTALHVAQCQAALGHVVEAEEDYRALANAKIPEGSPQAFYEAQDQAKTELATVEPRVPKVKVMVVPDHIAGLVVTIDGVTLNSALVGVPRPVNPGTHRIVATAPGYERAEQAVTVQEKDTRDVPLTLRASAQTTTPPVVNNTPPPRYGTGNQGTVWAGSTPGEWRAPYTQPKKTGPSTSLMIGLTLGASLPVGGFSQDLVSGTTVTSQKITDLFSTAGFAVGGDVGLRFARKGYIGGVIQGAFFGAGPPNTANPNNAGRAFLLGLVLGIITNPEGVGFYGDIGGGYRSFAVSTNSLKTGAPVSFSFSGPEALLSLGIHIKAGPMRIIPKASMGAGVFTTYHDDTSSQSLSSSATPAGPGVTGHAFFMLGVNAFFDIPFGSSQQ